MLRGMRRVLGICEKVVTSLSLLSVFMMMILTTADSIGRYALHLPIKGAYEIIQDYLMVIAVFFGVCYAYRGGGYIRVDFLVDRLPRKARVGVNYLSQVCCVLLSIVFVWAAILKCLRSFALGENLPLVWNFPLWPAYAVIPVGLCLATFIMILDLWDVRKKSAQ